MGGTRRITTALVRSRSNSRQLPTQLTSGAELRQVETQHSFEPRLLLLDSNECHAQELAAYLEAQHYSVKIFHDPKNGLDALRRDQASFDVLIFYLSGSHESWTALESLLRTINPSLPEPGVLCVLKADRGPNVILLLEEKGVRCVIEE